LTSVVDLQTQTGHLTLDDVARLADAAPDQRYELDRGHLLVMAPPNLEHGVLTTRLTVWPPDLVLANAGLKVCDTSGRNPDLMLLRRPVPGTTVWVDPADVTLVVEIVSPGSEHLDRFVKPVEYARAGVVRYWRIERNPATLHRYNLDRDTETYAPAGVIGLDDLLADPPTLPLP
jgi:Uma2 family endonuclease